MEFYATSAIEMNPVDVEVELNAANCPGVTVKYSPSTLALIFRPLLPTVTVVEAPIESQP